MYDTIPGSTSARAEGQAAIEHLSANAQEAAHRVADAASSAARTVGEKGRLLLSDQEHLLEAARDCVRQHPIASVSIAVGIGLLLSRLTSR